MPTEQWILYLDRTYRALPWPWPGREWNSLTAADVAALPHAVDDFSRVAPSDGIDLSVPSGLPRKVARCLTRMAVYHDDQWLYIFTRADRPEPLPELADMARDDFGCVIQLGGLHRGIYLGLNEKGEHIGLPSLFDPSLQLAQAMKEWPWNQPGRFPAGDQGVYDGRAIPMPAGGVTATWKVRRNRIQSGFEGNRIRFTVSRRCYQTSELVAWAASPLWAARASEMGTAVLVQKPEDAAGLAPTVRRIDAIYDWAAETATLRTRWQDLWSDEEMAELRKSVYTDHNHRVTVALNGQEQTCDIAPAMEHGFAIPDGWNRLEVMCGFAAPMVVNFQKFSGSRIIPIRAHVRATSLPPVMSELRTQFAQWHAVSEKKYLGEGVWGDPAGQGKHNISHNGAFYMEPYALACLHLERQEVYVQRVREFCERALKLQHPRGYFNDLAVDPDGTTPFYGGAFDTGSAGESIVLGYRVLGDPRYLEASRRIIDAYQLYRFETNQNYAAFAVWHLSEHHRVEPSEAAVKLAVFYGSEAAKAIDLAGAQDGHNFYSGYGGITLKGLAKLLGMIGPTHPAYPYFRNRVIRMCNQMIARQQVDGRFAERNRKYLGYHSLAPAVGLLETAFVLGGEIETAVRPPILAAYEAQRGGPDGGIVARMARALDVRGI